MIAYLSLRRWRLYSGFIHDVQDGVESSCSVNFIAFTLDVFVGFAGSADWNTVEERTSYFSILTFSYTTTTLLNMYD